ncbi:uncharacterized protein LOC136076270 [Hydra vulgaris]|uniref:Uncharacterized protein LOC136076270 n=1 Tax=Hydra vulgaris TaxID=6087 RepID=A0ABM4BA92_HYDVU
MAKFTVSQVKDLLDIHENTLLKIFNEKFDKMEIKLLNLQEENTKLKKETNELKKSAEFLSEKYEAIVQELSEMKKKPNLTSNQNDITNVVVKDKLAELEDRSRRNNLRFTGIEEDENETWELSEEKIQNVLKTKLGFKSNVEIERAHRTGKKSSDGKKYNRTIIVKFLNYKDKKTALDNYVQLKLWNDRFYVNEDYSERTLELRKQLFKEAKDLRAKGKYAKVVYNKHVTRDF